MVLVWSLIFIFIIAVSLWSVFVKAGREGWEALIPVYNGYRISEIAGYPGWVGLILYIPFIFNFVSATDILVYTVHIATLVVYLILSLGLAKAFKKSALFGVVGLFIFSFFGFMILGWGDAKYAKPARD